MRSSSLKAQLEGELLMYDCSGLARLLVRHGLVDEIRLWVHPVVWRRGERLFHDGEAVPLKLVDSTSFGADVTLLRYQPANHGQPGPASRS
jgi:dihydrofolate reductase